MNWSVNVAIGREMPLFFRRKTAVEAIVMRVKEDGCGRRHAALKMVDRQLAKGNFKLAVSLVKQLQRQPLPAGIRGFAAAKQVPRSVTSIEELHLSVTESSAVESLFDSILDSLKSSLQSSPLEEEEKTYVTSEDNDIYLEDDIIQHKQVVQHEAGHFLVGYLLGVLPKHYKFSAIRDVKKDEIIDASVKFIGFEFLTELEDVVLTKKNQHEVKPRYQVLSKFACVIVGGLVAEHLEFRDSKGHHADVEKLDRVLKWLQFTKDEENALIRWAVLNTLLMLRRHGEARSTLVEAMSHGRSIANCIHMIEATLNHENL